MAISINWATKVITVPRADMLLVQSVPTEIRELDIDTFRNELNDLSDDAEGMPWPTTHNHNPPVSVGGVTLARVVQIINGYTITFEDGQYAVNLSGANSNLGDVTNVNQVSVRSANSAGLTYSKEVEDQSFSDSRVWVNTVSGLPGTQFPRGTPGDPVSNLADAQGIITARSLPKRIFLRGTLVLGGGDDLSDYDIEGSSAELAAIAFGGAATNNLVVSSVGMSGDTSGFLVADTASSFASISSFQGQMINCGLKDTVTLGGSGAHSFIECYSLVAGTSTPAIDCDDFDNVDLSIRSYTGGIEIKNYSGASNACSVDLNSGHLILDSTCTAGVMVVRGDGHITDNSTGTVVVKVGLTSEAVWIHPQASSLTALNSRTDNL